MQIRTGSGWDRHRLKTGENLKLAGVQIDCGYSAVGHSDADAPLHALIDALLGAAGLGDIGMHFPPGERRWKDASSLDLLGQIVELLQQKQWQVVNVDLTIIFEPAKLSSFRSEMEENIAQLIPGVESVNVKFKSAEGLGPVGKNEAVDALASVLIKNFKI